MQATSPRARGPFMWDFFGLMPPDGEAQEGDYYSGFECGQPLLPAGVEWQPYERQGLYMAVRIEPQERLKGSGQDRAGGMMGYAESAEGTAAKIEKVDMMGHAESPKGAQTDAEGAPIEQLGIEKDDKSAEAAKTDTDAANQVGITKDAKRSAEAAKIEQEGMKGADTIAKIPQIGKSSAENDQAEMPSKMQATSPRARGPCCWSLFGEMPDDGEAQEGHYYIGFKNCQPRLPAGVVWQLHDGEDMYMAVRIEPQERLKGGGQDRAGGMMRYAESAEGTQTDAEGAPIEQLGIEKDDKSAEAAKTDTDAANQVGITKDAKRSAEAAKIEQEGMKGADTIAKIPQIGKSSAENDQAEMPIKMRRVGSSASAGGNDDDDEDDNFIDADALEAYLNARGINPNLWGKICRVHGVFEECFVDGSMDDISDPFENPAISLVDVLKTLNMKFTYKGTEYDSRAKRPTM